MQAEQATESTAPPTVGVVAVVSVPMCGWNPHWGCLTDAMRPFGIPVRLAYGAYWHQSMSNLLEECMEDRADWVLACDYDSMMTAAHVGQLIERFGRNPHMDALAALQCKRSTDEVPLLTVDGATRITVAADPIKVDTAHFGMTLIRLASLARVPRPWFEGRADPDGSYRTLGRTDPDIAFWHSWRAAGNTLYVDPLCSIGHLQPMVAEFDEQLKPRHVHAVDWRRRERAKMAAAAQKGHTQEE